MSKSTSSSSTEEPPEGFLEIGHVRRPHGLEVAVQGDGFLYNMVRSIAGTLREVGQGKMAPDRVGEVLKARDRSRAGPTAEPGGLYLVRILYSRADLDPGPATDDS